MKKLDSFKSFFALVVVALFAFTAHPVQAAVTLEDLAGTYSFVATGVSEKFRQSAYRVRCCCQPHRQ